MFKLLPSIGLVMVVTTTLFVSGGAALKLSQAIPHIDEIIAAPSNLQQVDSALGLSAGINNGNGSTTGNAPVPANATGTTNTTKTGSTAQNTVTNVGNKGGLSAVANTACVVTISGSSYDITSLRASHSGGNIFTCGTDMTASYNSQHGSNVTRMQAYKITTTNNKTNTTTSPNTTQPVTNNTNTTTSPSTTQPVTNNTNTTQPPASNGTFTATTLAQHNTPGNCYIAYKGSVYNVSNHPSWRNCSHYGNRGGIDITSLFPHRTTYLSSLPVVGTYDNGGVVPPSNNRRSGDDNDNERERDDDKNEKREVENDKEKKRSPERESNDNNDREDSKEDDD